MSETDAARAARRAVIERKLERYPHLSPEGLTELTEYFHREASSLDLALIASNEAIREPYRQFRAEHVDPLKPKDWLRGLAFAAVVAALAIAIMWRAF